LKPENLFAKINQFLPINEKKPSVVKKAISLKDEKTINKKN
jgi:hypothetical protein